MKAVNTFTDKIVSDLDASVISPQQWVFPTVGVRIFNKDGKGLIASVVPGNKLLTEITSGFTPLGAKDENGIIYIVSYSEFSGQGEIGTYPSPTGSGFVSEYRPLQNFNNGISIGDFRTTLFNFDFDHLVDILIKPSFDGSVDLYLCDFKNPNRTVNSGFNQLGEYNTRTYVPGSFDGMIDQLPFSTKDIRTTTGAGCFVDAGGYLKPGNYFIYLQYLTADYASTRYIKEIGPFTVGNGTTVRTQSGLQEKDWLHDFEQVTDKKIVLNLSSIDTNYSYIRIGIARYTAMQENAAYSKDTYQIDKYYSINGSTMRIDIYGNESEALLVFDTLIKPINDYNICKSHIQILNRYLGINWKRAPLVYDRDALKTFAQKITIGHFYNTTVYAEGFPTIDDYENNIIPIGGYKDPDNIYKYLGYFKNQIYPFGIQFEFDNGSYSEWFPVKGKNDPDINGTYKGLYRFPDWESACSINGVVSQKYITGVQFDIIAAMTYFNGLSEDKFGSVIGFRFGRGERIDNLICQGVLIRGFYGVMIDITTDEFATPILKDMTFQSNQVSVPDPDTPGSTISMTGNEPTTASIMPLLSGNMPMVKNQDENWYYGYSKDKMDIMFPAWASYKYCLTLPSREDYFGNNQADHFNKHGVFSPDILFGKEFIIPSNAFLEPLFHFHDNNFMYNYMKGIGPGNGYNTPPEYALDLNESIGYCTLNDKTQHMVQAAFVDDGHYKGKYNFGSYLPGDGEHMAFNFNEGAIRNRNIYTSRYVGVVDQTTGKQLQYLYGPSYHPKLKGYSIVNIYRYENNDDFFNNARSSYNIASSFYAPISNRYSFEHTEVPIKIYKGDCFLQKTWFRQSRWKTMEHHGEGDDACGFSGYGSPFLATSCQWYQHGMMIGIVTENKYNSEMRNDILALDDNEDYLGYTFYPKCLGNGINTLDWARQEGGAMLIESLQINDGYNHVLSDNITLGFDYTEPEHEDTKPNRTYISDEHISGAFFDGYRQIQIGSYRDYGIDSGPINDVVAILDYPALIHERGINQLYLNEKNVQQGESGDLIMGSSQNFLSDRIRKLASYGTQHKSSIIEGLNGVYGFDEIRRIYWRIDRKEGQGGGFYLNVDPISTSLLVQHWIKELLNSYSSEGDITHQLPDLPLKGTGIVGGYDPEFKEILMSFMFNKDGQRYDKTLVFDEILNGFRGEYPFAEPLYFNLGNMLLSAHHYLDDAYQYKVDNKIARYNQITDADGLPNYNKFFGVQKTMQLSFIVNGLSQDPKENTSKLEKIFESMFIESRVYPLSRIIYETLYQHGIYIFQDAGEDFWMDAEYEGHKWHVPIVLQTSETGEQFDSDSEMNGIWMKVTIEYTGNKDLELKSIETNYNISK